MTIQASRLDQKPYGYIYKITNLVNGKVYIGQTTKTVLDRWKKHLDAARYGKYQTYLYNAIRKYGVGSFTIDEIDIAKDHEDINNKECVWIEKLDSLNPNGYNIRSGGNQSPFAQETKDKISASTKKQMQDPLARERISKAQKGRLRTDEQKRNMSLAKKGKKLPFTDEWRKNLAVARKEADYAKTNTFLEQNGNRWFRVFLKDGTIVGDYINMTKCAKDLGVTRSMVSYWLAGKITSITYNFAFIDGLSGTISSVIGKHEVWAVYDLNGKLLGEYINKTACAEALGVSVVEVSRWISGKVKSRKYVFKLVEKRAISC